METNEQTQDRNILIIIQKQQEEILKRLEDTVIIRKDVLSFSEGVKYLDLSESHLYKLTSKRKIPHYKQGKLIYFVRGELDKWLTQDRIKTKEELEHEASTRLRKLRA